MDTFGKKAKLIGQGTSGKVYQLGKDYALKESTTSSFPNDFIKEITVYHRLESDYVLPLAASDLRVNSSKSGRLAFTSSMVFPLADHSLADFTRKYHDERITGMPVKTILKELLLGLCQLHQAGVYHFDIKPANILVKDKHLYYTDFGLAELDACAYRLPMELKVTSYYRAPELFGAFPELTDRADVWSFGVVIAEILLNDQEDIFLFSGYDDREIERKIEDFRMGKGQARSMINRLPPKEKELIEAILIPDPFYRPSIFQVAAMEYFQLTSPPRELSCLNTVRSVLREIPTDGWRDVLSRKEALEWMFQFRLDDRSDFLLIEYAHAAAILDLTIGQINPAYDEKMESLLIAVMDLSNSIYRRRNFSHYPSRKIAGYIEMILELLDYNLNVTTPVMLAASILGEEIELTMADRAIVQSKFYVTASPDRVTQAIIDYTLDKPNTDITLLMKDA